MVKPFFSIIIPTYNQSSFLEKALISVFAQNYKNYEIIVVDNNSNDDTSRVIKKYKKKIIYKKIKNNGIIAKSRNLGIKIAQGQWLAFLDSDDYWEKTKLYNIHKFIKKYFFDVICHSEWLLKRKIQYCSYGPFEKNFYEKLLRYGNRFSMSATVVKKNFLIKKKILFDQKKIFISSEDYSFFMHLAREQANFFFTLKPLGYHLFHQKSISSKLTKHIKSSYMVKKYHVLKLQNFTKNKKKLLKDAKAYLDLKIILFNSKKSGRYNQIKKIYNFFLEKPKYTILYLQNLIYKKLKDNLLYVFFKSSL